MLSRQKDGSNSRHGMITRCNRTLKIVISISSKGAKAKKKDVTKMYISKERKQDVYDQLAGPLGTNDFLN